MKDVSDNDIKNNFPLAAAKHEGHRSIVKIGGTGTLVVSALAFFWGYAASATKTSADGSYCLLWVGAVLAGAAWVFLNFYFLFRLLDISFSPAPKSNPATQASAGRDKILLWSILKFPVIYVAGFFILKSRFFPVSGILTGLTIFFAALIFSWGNFYRGNFGASRRHV